MSVKCEVVNITLRDEQGNTTSLEVPAYTRTQASFVNTLDDLKNQYLIRSNYEGEGMSIADFALFLLSFSADKEPKEQSEKAR